LHLRGDPDRARRAHLAGDDLRVHHGARGVMGPGRGGGHARADPDRGPGRPRAALPGGGPRGRRREGVRDRMGTVRTLDVEGYIAAPVLPLRDDGAIDLEGMARYVRWIADDRP